MEYLHNTVNTITRLEHTFFLNTEITRMNRSGNQC